MTTANYLWDPITDSYLAETDDLFTTTATYTVEPIHYGRIISYRRAADTSYYQYDGLTSTRELTEEGEAVASTNLYDAWGVNRVSSGALDNPFLYVGELGYHDDGMPATSYVRARTFSSQIARWAAADPVGHIDGPHLYRYGKNNPLANNDPSGLRNQNVTILVPPNNTRITYPCAVPDGPRTVCDTKTIPVNQSDNASVKCGRFKASIPGDEIIIRIQASMSSRNCAVPPIKCGCCLDECFAGAWNTPDAMIICAKDTLTEDAFLNLVRHEMTHAYQRCRGTLGGQRDCRTRLRAEFQAAYCASWPLMRFELALKDAVWSTCWTTTCNAGNLQEAVRQLYDWFVVNAARMCNYPTAP